MALSDRTCFSSFWMIKKSPPPPPHSVIVSSGKLDFRILVVAIFFFNIILVHAIPLREKRGSMEKKMPYILKPCSMCYVYYVVNMSCPITLKHTHTHTQLLGLCLSSSKTNTVHSR